MSLKNLSVKTKIPKLLKKKLDNKKITQIYNKFAKSLQINDRFAVAVSGGPDSLALAFLAKVYSIKKKFSPKFFIVDHKLRPESTLEAINVKKILRKFNIFSEILTWEGKKPSKNIQSISRNKRYELLFKRCNKLKIKYILLGHHLDDLFENFFIRMLRGSGLKGLVSLDKKSKSGSKYLIRPLLNEKKEHLIFLSKFVFDFYIKDSSNDDEKFQRVKIRKFIKSLQKNGLDDKKFFKTIENLKYSNQAINFYVRENLEKNTFYSIKNHKLTLNKKFFLQPYEIVFRALSESIQLIGKRYYSVRGKKLVKTMEDIRNNKSFRATLGGCMIEKVNQTVIISKES